MDIVTKSIDQDARATGRTASSMTGSSSDFQTTGPNILPRLALGTLRLQYDVICRVNLYMTLLEAEHIDHVWKHGIALARFRRSIYIVFITGVDKIFW